MFAISMIKFYSHGIVCHLSFSDFSRAVDAHLMVAKTLTSIIPATGRCKSIATPQKATMSHTKY